MCGRYTLFTDKEYQDIRKIIRAVQEKGHEVKTGEIYPTNPAPILVWEGKETVPQAVKWGWPKFQGSGVLINAHRLLWMGSGKSQIPVYSSSCQYLIFSWTLQWIPGRKTFFDFNHGGQCIGFLYPQPYAGDYLSGNDRYLAGGHRKSGAHASLAAARTSYCYTIKYALPSFRKGILYK